MLRRIDLRGQTAPVEERLRAHHTAEETTDAERLEAVRGIIAQVRQSGDKAVRKFTSDFDGVDVDQLEVTKTELEAAFGSISKELQTALVSAVERVEAYHRHQIPTDQLHKVDGVAISERHKPVANAGCYVPGGRAIYPSTVIMTVVPARLAGVGDIAVAVPPGPDGNVPDVVRAAAFVAGADRLYQMGGAQAIAAMAYGTKTVQKVDAIAGPGNVYVSLAQREVAGMVRVPSAFAGPSEVVVYADATANPTFVAIDLILQAEHGPDGLSWLVTTDEAMEQAVTAEVTRQVGEADRQDEIKSTLESNGYAVLCDSESQAIEVIDYIAAEHVELMVESPETVAEQIDNAGAIFCGTWAPASLGDYGIGPNHVLPTNRTARFAGALGVQDFMKSTHIVSMTEAGLRNVAPQVVTLACAEGLTTHADSVKLRLDTLDSQ